MVLFILFFLSFFLPAFCGFEFLCFALLVVRAVGVLIERGVEFFCAFVFGGARGSQ